MYGLCRLLSGISRFSNMIDFVTRGNEVLIIRDNQPFHGFDKNDILEEDSYYLISRLNSECRRLDFDELNLLEEEQFIDLQIYAKTLSKRRS